MNEHIVILKLNQQQLELLDCTVAKGTAPDRASLIRIALREYAAKAEAAKPAAAGGTINPAGGNK